MIHLTNYPFKQRKTVHLRI